MPPPIIDKEFKGLMPIDEAVQILQVPQGFTSEMIEERYMKLFKINDPTKGGSFYIQCKIMGARLTLLDSINASKPQNPETGSAEGGEEKTAENENKEAKPDDK